MDPLEVARLVKKLTLSTEVNQPSVTVSATGYTGKCDSP